MDVSLEPEQSDLSLVLFEDSPSSSPCSPGSEADGASGGAFEVFGTSVEEAVREMRFRIEQKTTLTASAGEFKTTDLVKKTLLCLQSVAVSVATIFDLSHVLNAS